METITQNAKGTFDFGTKVGNSLKGGEIIALTGEMGAGKTTFVQGIANGLSINKSITSPTFILMRSYEVTNSNNIRSLYHLDLYRLESEIEEELENLGIFDLWGEPHNVFVIEWSEKIAKSPKNAITIKIEVLDENSRKFTYEHTF